MGQYWKPVNVTRKEWIHPHTMNDGLKWGEWSHPDRPTVTLMRAAWNSADEIYAVSDYGGLKRVDMTTETTKDHGWKSIGFDDLDRGPEHAHVPEYDDIEEWGKHIGGGNLPAY
jgi:hypothetical protein